MYINNLGRMTKMAAMPIYGKNASNIFSKTNRLISLKLGVKHPWLKYYNVYINHGCGPVFRGPYSPRAR